METGAAVIPSINTRTVSDGKGLRVLVASQQELVCVGMGLILVDHGFDVVARCANGLEAVDAAARLHPDVAILEWFAPGLNGINAGTEICRISPQTRIVLMGDWDERDTEMQHVAEGIVAYFCKRHSLDGLLRLVREVSQGVVCRRPRLRYPSRPHSTDQLSARECQVLQLLAESVPMKQVCDLLHVNVKTVEGHRSKVMAKLRVQDVGGLVRYAIRNGIIKV